MKSRMRRESQVRICESLRGWFPRATRLQDITERKQAEQKNQQLGNVLEQSLNEVYIINSETLAF